MARRRRKKKKVLLTKVHIWHRELIAAQLESFLGRSEPTEAHHVHHIVAAVNLHRRVLRKLETRLFSLGLFCSLLFSTRGQLFVADLGYALVKVESLRFRRLLGLCA